MKQESFAVRLNSLLESSQVPINQVASELNVSRQSIYNWLSSNSISKSSLVKVADYFKVSAHWLRYGQVGVSNQIELNGYQQYIHKKTPPISSAEYHALHIHLSSLNVLFGYCCTQTGQLDLLGNYCLLKISGRKIPTDLSELIKLLSPYQQFKLKRAFIKVFKQGKKHWFNIRVTLGRTQLACAILLAKNVDNEVDSISFHINVLD